MIERIKGDLIIAMRAKDEVTKTVIRALKTDMELKAKELKRDLTEEEALAIVSYHIKQTKESIEAYDKGGRADLVNEEKAKLDKLSMYMPKQLEEYEIVAEIDNLINDLGLDTSNKGLLMKTLMPKFKGRADGSLVSKVISTYVK